MFGIDPAEWIYSHEAWVALIHPDDRGAGRFHL